jgi:hypothetical protein
VIVRITSPIRITEGIELKRAFGIEKAMIHSVFEKSEDMFSSCPMSRCKVMKMLT